MGNEYILGKLLDRLDHETVLSMIKTIKVKPKKALEERAVDVDVDKLSRILKKFFLKAFLIGGLYAYMNLPHSILELEEPLEDELTRRIAKVLERELNWQLLAPAVEALGGFNGAAAYFRPPQSMLDMWETYSMKLAGNLSKDLIKEIDNTLVDAWQQGLGIQDTYELLKEKIQGLAERRLKAIARTESTRAANFGAIHEGMKNMWVEGYRFTAVLDERTTRICQSRNGKFIPKNDPDLLADNTPPLHVNCRSMLIPVTESKDLPIMPKDWPSDLMPKTRFTDRLSVYQITQETPARFAPSELKRAIQTKRAKAQFEKEFEKLMKQKLPELKFNDELSHRLLYEALYSKFEETPKIEFRDMNRSLGVYNSAKHTVYLQPKYASIENDYRVAIHEFFHAATLKGVVITEEEHVAALEALTELFSTTKMVSVGKKITAIAYRPEIRQYLAALLEKNGWNITRAAREFKKHVITALRSKLSPEHSMVKLYKSHVNMTEAMAKFRRVREEDRQAVEEFLKKMGYSGDEAAMMTLGFDYWIYRLIMEAIL